MNIKYEARMERLLNQRMNDVHQILRENKEYAFIRHQLNSINHSLIESFSSDQRKNYKESITLHKKLRRLVKSEMYFQGWRDAFELLEFFHMLSK